MSRDRIDERTATLNIIYNFFTHTFSVSREYLLTNMAYL